MVGYTGANLSKDEILYAKEHMHSYEREYTQKVRVGVYARVSTKHKEQLSALENQESYLFDTVVNSHPNWKLINKYTDRGISGTGSHDRPEFDRMLQDAEDGKLDLIVVKEVSRIARNTILSLTVVERLKEWFVEVYYVRDNLWTFQSDYQMRLTYISSAAEEESRRLSERSKLGQLMSRSKGVVYGNGNILGYRRNLLTKKLEIDEEEAETVRMIFNWYVEGKGMLEIVRLLTINKRKCRSGEVSWQVSKVSRILNRTTYKGVMTYGQSISEGYKTQKRITVSDKAKQQRVPVDVPKIVDDATWNKAEEIRNSKVIDSMTKPRSKVKTLWCRILVCSCGSSFRRDKWRADAKGTVRYGYVCYNQLNTGTLKVRKKKGLPLDGVCTTNSIPDWKLDLLARESIKRIWVNWGSVIAKALDMLEEIKVLGNSLKNKMLDEKANMQSKLEKAQERYKNYAKMMAEGLIDKDEYIQYRTETKQEIQELTNELDKLITVKSNQTEPLSIVKKRIQNTFGKVLDFNQAVLPDELIEFFITRVLASPNQHFEVYISLDGVQLNNHYPIPSSFQVIPFDAFDIDYNFARKYVKTRKGILRVTQWCEDMHIKVNILINITG